MTPTWITICDTCKRDDWAARGTSETDGARLARLVEAAAAGTGIRTRRISCLMGCDHSCNIAIQAAGKLCYTLGRFEPAAGDAEGIVAYAAHHAASETGQVPYRDWPQAVKGHFITRHPPLPDAGTDTGTDTDTDTDTGADADTDTGRGREAVE